MNSTVMRLPCGRGPKPSTRCTARNADRSSDGDPLRVSTRALDGTPMAVLSNKPAKLSKEILEELQLARHFRGIYGGDSFAAKKPDPSGVRVIVQELGAAPEEAAMVGDSDVDIQTARNAGMFAIGVSYGFGQRDSRAYPADVSVDDLRELAPLGRKSKG